MKNAIQWAAMLCACLMVTTAFAAGGTWAAATGERVLRVGFPMQGQLSFVDEYGNYSGYTYDYLQEIAQYTGWEYEIVEVAGEANQALASMLDLLAEGELDLLGGLVKNAYTEELFDFPEYGYGHSYTSLYVPEDNSVINETNYATVKNLRIAIQMGATQTKERVEDFCKANNVDYTLVECDNGEDGVTEAVRSGRADVIVGSDLVPVEGFRTIAQFNGTQYYFATTKGNTALLNELNRTIHTIQQVKPYFDAQLYEKYFSKRTERTYLTDAERTYVASAAPLRIAMPQTLPPIQYENGNDGFQGLSKELLDRIQEETGLRFTYLATGSYEEAFQMLADREADAVCGIPYEYALAQKHKLVMTTTFLDAQRVLVTRIGQTGSEAGMRVGLLGGLDPPENLREEQEVSIYPSALACMEAVERGEVDCAYLNLYSAEYLSHMTGFKNLHLIPQTGETTDFCIGIRKPVSTTLISIMNKAINNFPSTELESIIYQNTSDYQEDVTLKLLIEANPVLSVCVVIVFFMALAAVGLLLLRQRIRTSRRLEVEQQRYLQLCQMANEYIYEYNSKKDTLTLSREFSKLFAMPEKIERFMDAMSGQHLEPSMNLDMFRLFRQLIDSTAGVETEYLCTLPSGEVRWYRGTQAEILDQDGQVTYVIGKLTDIQEEREEKAALEQQLQIDGLTGIYNAVTARRLIGQRLESMRKPGALLILDIDYFKAVNDQLGHYVGDMALIDFAGMLLRNAGEKDIVGRLGGDEFVLFLDNAVDRHWVEQFCETLCREARRQYEHEGQIHTISISVGAALLRQGCAFEEVYQAVDQALYHSKGKGRDGWTLIE